MIHAFIRILLLWAAKAAVEATSAAQRSSRHLVRESFLKTFLYLWSGGVFKYLWLARRFKIETNFERIPLRLNSRNGTYQLRGTTSTVVISDLDTANENLSFYMNFFPRLPSTMRPLH